MPDTQPVVAFLTVRIKESELPTAAVLKSVSYTHLDVYKRQLGTAPAGRSDGRSGFVDELKMEN